MLISLAVAATASVLTPRDAVGNAHRLAWPLTKNIAAALVPKASSLNCHHEQNQNDQNNEKLITIHSSN